MKVLDLFSGIGGFSLGLEAAGMETIAFCEREPFCQEVLKKHWPDIPCHDDVTTLDGKQYNGTVDVIAGGFPCQDISLAGKGAGLAGERSGLWFEYLRIIKEAQPRYVIIENVSALRSRGLEEVLRSLAEIGYDAEWHCIPASAVGAPHQRDRIWIVAYAQSKRYECGESSQQTSSERTVEGGRTSEGLWLTEPCNESSIRSDVSNSTSTEQQGHSGRELHEQERHMAATRTEDLRQEDGQASPDFARSDDKTLAYPNGQRGRLWNSQRQDAEDAWESSRRSQFWNWDVEPDVGRVADGIPARTHRLRCLGNSIVPQIAQIIGQAIMEYENDRT